MKTNLHKELADIRKLLKENTKEHNSLKESHERLQETVKNEKKQTRARPMTLQQLHSALAVDHDHDIKTLVVGQAPLTFVRLLYFCVLPDQFDERNYHSIGKLQEFLKDKDLFDNDREWEEANSRYKQIQENIGWSEEMTGSLKVVKDARKKGSSSNLAKY